MDILVVVGPAEPPERLLARARRVERIGGEVDVATVGHVRAHLPREVGVYGSGVEAIAAAHELHRAGLPVVLYRDDTDAGGDDPRLGDLSTRPPVPRPRIDAATSLLDLVGHTPLVHLDRTARDLDGQLLAKLEMLNPGGSVKDRPAVSMIDAAEADGRLQPGGTIVEPTSGNTGVGLAIVAARRGYSCIFVMPDKIAPEKVALLRAYGAEVIVCPTTVEPEHPDSYYSVSNRLVKEIPGAFKPDQYHNQANPAAHVASTGPEIWAQTGGRITHFVAGIGTGGTITGVGHYLKAQNPDVQVVGADPEGSVYSGGSGRPYLVEGIGEDFWPTSYDPSVVDRVVEVSDRDSFLTARRVTREEGILIGGSGGTAVWAAVEVGRELGPDAVIVVLLPDSGRGYLSKLYNDEWMADFGFLRASGQSVGEVLAAKSADLPALVHAHPDESVRDVIALFREFSVSQVPVVKAEPPLAAAEVSGAAHERDLLEQAFGDPAVLDRPISEVMGPPMATVGVGEPVDTVVERLESASAVLVLDGGHPVGVLTRSDLLGFLTAERAMTEPDGGWAFETRAIHAGQLPDPTTGAVVTPISLATTFAQSGVGQHQGYEYARSANPTRTALEACLADLEGARHGLAFASGLAAEDTILRLLRPGDHVLLSVDAYGGTFRLAARVHTEHGLTVEARDLTDLAAVEADWREGTRLVWVETPTNPRLSIVDIAEIARLAHDRGAWCVVDNTFATPYLQSPLALGADLVVHSSTKYLGGHSDVVGGFVATSDDAIAEDLRFLQNAVGAVPGPFDCFLVLRGVKTLAVRMDRHEVNAAAVVDALGAHPSVAEVHWPGLPSHPQHGIARRQMRGFGGMVSFTLRGGEEAALRVAESTEVFTLAESLGAVESLVEHPARMTHASVADAPGAVDPALLRLSVGIEAATDLVADLRQALDRA